MTRGQRRARRPDPHARREARERRRERNAHLSGDEAVAAAKEAALRLLDRQARSCGEVRVKLAEYGYRPEPIECVIDRLICVGLLDDREFATRYAERAHHQRGLVGQALALALRRKYIDDALIRDVVEDVAGSAESTARALAERKLAGIAHVGRDRACQRAAAYLARRGYAPAMTWRVINEAWSQLEGED